MIDRLLLSIVTISRNDQYHENLLQRTKFIINYFIYTIKKTNAEKKVEYIFVDWGSDDPFSNYFHKEISTCSAIKFINVPKKETEKSILNFDTSSALKLGTEHALGEHILFTGSDQFFPLSIFNNFLNILEKPEVYGLTGNEFKLIPRKFIDDDFLIYENNMEKVNLYLQNLKQSMKPFKGYPMNSGGGAGGNLVKKKQLLEIGGIKDTRPHNDGQDSILMHELSKCTHIDTATFGFFLLKLPRTIIGTRQQERKLSADTEKSWKFGKYENFINFNNIEIIDYLNPPLKKNFPNLKPTFMYRDLISFKEIVKAINDCSFLLDHFKLSLKTNDISLILKIKRIIKINKIKIIIFDERQSVRFLFYFAKNFPETTFYIFLDPKKYSPVDIIKFRTKITSNLKKSLHYGHIKIDTFDQGIFKFINTSQNVCIIQDLSEDINDSTYFKKEFSLSKINAIRVLKKNTKIVDYNIDSEFDLEQIQSKVLKFNKLINFIIYFIIFILKFKKILRLKIT